LVSPLKGLGNLVDGFPFFQQSQSQSLLFFIELLQPPELDPALFRCLPALARFVTEQHHGLAQGANAP
jgi:hypothetical protein